MKTTNWPWWVTVSLVMTAGLSLVGAFPRYQAEQANRAVGIAVEGDVVEELAVSQGLTYQAGMEQLAEAGVNVLSSNEQTVGEFLSNGLLVMSPYPNGKFLLRGHERTMQRVLPAYKDRFLASAETQNGLVLDDANLVRNLPIGLRPQDYAVSSALGMPILGRMGNPRGASEGYIVSTVRRAKGAGDVRYFLPLGDEVLGSPKNLAILNQALLDNGIYYVPAEFGKTVGESSVVAKVPENVVRLHAAQAAELVRMPQSAIVERYVKSARERNIRLLLVRPSVTSSPNALDDFAGLIRAIRHGLAKEGLTAKAPRPYTAPHGSVILTAFIGLSMIPALGFVIGRLLSLAGAESPLTGWILAVGIGLMSNLPQTRELTTLASAVLMPILAYIWFFEKPGRNVFISYLGVTAISLTGGLPIAGLLVGLDYMLHADVFTGVKVAVFLPVFVVAWIVIQQLTHWREAMKQPIVWGSALTAVGVLLGLAFMYMRTGNDNPAAVSGLELKVRDLLDQWLVVRPRTKEFLIGHPAVFVGMAIWARTMDTRWRAGGGFLLVVGAIGQTSVVNTMCHLHTPIHLSLIRIGIGLVIGCILGFLGWLLLGRFVPRAVREN